jgi:hypothetical protein
MALVGDRRKKRKGKHDLIVYKMLESHLLRRAAVGQQLFVLALQTGRNLGMISITRACAANACTVLHQAVECFRTPYLIAPPDEHHTPENSAI